MSSKTLEFGIYVGWANHKLLNMLEPLPADHWTRELGGSFETLLGTANHHFWALDVWLNRLTGNDLGDRFPVDSGAEAMPLYRAVDERFAAWVKGLTESDLGEVRELKRGEMVMAVSTEDILLHLVNHSSYHRGQVVDQLRRLGHKVVSSDYFYFVLEKSG